MELVPRTAAPVHATGAVSFVPLSAVAADATFRLRDEGDVSVLASSMGRLGQLVPVELRPLPGAAPGGPRYQLVAGFRRVAAARMLQRDRVLARVHAVLDDEDAWAVALAQALLVEPLLGSELEALRARIGVEPAAAWAQEVLDGAVARAPVDPAQRERFLAWLAEARARRSDERAAGEGEGGGDVEVTAEELTTDLAQRMWEVNQDLAVAADAWAELPREGRRLVLEQARWVAQLLRHLEGGR
jgi:ParB-like chromosome segregation protein Spo0J